MNTSNLGVIHPYHNEKEPEPTPGPPDYDPKITRYHDYMLDSYLGSINPVSTFIDNPITQNTSKTVFQLPLSHSKISTLQEKRDIAKNSKLSQDNKTTVVQTITRVVPFEASKNPSKKLTKKKSSKPSIAQYINSKYEEIEQKSTFY